jgi:hypothetical protein
MASWGVARRHAGRLALGAMLLLAPAAATAQASAATISVDRPCYVSTASTPAQMTLTGSGFTPRGQVSITSSDGSVADTTIADATGTIALTAGAPEPAFKLPGQKKITLTATDEQNSAITATTQTRAATVAVQTAPYQASVTRKVTWYFSGFTEGKLIFGHYIHHKQVALARFGRAQGPCGVLKAKARLFPGGHPQFRRYGLQIDDSRRYNKSALPRFVTRLGLQLKAL